MVGTAIYRYALHIVHSSSLHQTFGGLLGEVRLHVCCANNRGSTQVCHLMAEMEAQKYERHSQHSSSLPAPFVCRFEMTYVWDMYELIDL